MKVTRKRRPDVSPGGSQELIISTWRQMGEPSIGADELGRMQAAIADAFGMQEVLSPARIARELAQEGAELRHPEIIECDAVWREAQIENNTKGFEELQQFATDGELNLHRAELLIRTLENLRVKFGRGRNHESLAQLRTLAVDTRQTAQMLANDRTLNQNRRAEQSEIAEWLTVWIQTPNVFADWLELRRRSPDFHKKFSTEKSD